jgi:hypothetical protein
VDGVRHDHADQRQQAEIGHEVEGLSHRRQREDDPRGAERDGGEDDGDLAHRVELDGERDDSEREAEGQGGERRLGRDLGLLSDVTQASRA